MNIIVEKAKNLATLSNESTCKISPTVEYKTVEILTLVELSRRKAGEKGVNRGTLINEAVAFWAANQPQIKEVI